MRSEILQALDVGLDVLAKFTFYADITEAVLDERDLIGGKLVRLLKWIDLGCGKNLLRRDRANAVHVGQRDADTLLIWNVDSE